MANFDIRIGRTGGGGSGDPTNLSFTSTPTEGVVSSSTGTNATLTSATATNAGLLSAADKIAIDNGLGPTPTPRASITSFVMQGQSTSVNTGFSVSGTRTFTFAVNNPSLFNGNLTLSQAGVVLSTTISPTATSVDIIVNSATLVNVGDSLTFTLSGTSTTGTSVTRNFTIHVAGSSELIYYGTSSTNNAATINLTSLESRRVVVGDLVIGTGPTSEGNFFIILTPSNNPIHSIIDRNNQDVTNFFTHINDVRSINGILYTASLIGPLEADLDGESYTLNLT